MASTRQNNLLASLDWRTIGMALVLVLFGWMNVYAAGYTFETSSIFDFSNRAGKQFVWICGAGVLATLICLINYRLWSTFAYIGYGLMIILLLITPVLASNVKGSYSWISLGPVSLQPAEFAKCITALAIAKFMSQYGYRVRDLRDLAIPFAMMIVPMFIIMVLQSETGSALVLASMLIPFYREGMTVYILLSGLLAVVLFILSLRIGLAACAVVIALCLAAYLIIYRKRLFGYNAFLHYWREWLGMLIFVLVSFAFSASCNFAFNKVLRPHQQDRIAVLLGMRDDPAGVGYNVAQARIAIGSGQFAGKGYLQGTQTKLNFVPEQDTDFIFCTVGEEWGFIGSTLTLLVYLVFILRLYRLAERQKDTFARIYGYAVATIFLFHLTINVGMVLGLMPVIGIPLPFFSYGGSSLWGFTLLLFIFLRLDAARNDRLH